MSKSHNSLPPLIKAGDFRTSGLHISWFPGNFQIISAQSKSAKLSELFKNIARKYKIIDAIFVVKLETHRRQPFEDHHYKTIHSRFIPQFLFYHMRNSFKELLLIEPRVCSN